MADPIAIWGAITGSLALGLNAFKEIHERPRLVLILEAQASEGHAGWIGLEVSNRGRRPTTVVEAGFEVAVDIDFENKSRPGAPSRTGRPLLKAEEDPRVLPPGEVTRFRYSLQEWPTFVHADFPVRGYVTDSFSRTTWGSAAPLLRHLLNVGWRPPRGTPGELLEPVQVPLSALPVEPRWKVWKPRDLRKAFKPNTDTRHILTSRLEPQKPQRTDEQD